MTHELPEGWTPLRNDCGEIVAGFQDNRLWVVATGEVVDIPPPATVPREILLALAAWVPLL